MSKTTKNVILILIVSFIVGLLVDLLVVYRIVYGQTYVKQSSFEIELPEVTETQMLVSQVVAPEHPVQQLQVLASVPLGGQIQSTTCEEKGSEYWTTYINWMQGVTSEERNWLLAVSACESGRTNCDYNNTSSASGLFQFIPMYHPDIASNIWSGEAQIEYALYKYRMGGVGLWVASRGCWQPMIDSGQVY